MGYAENAEGVIKILSIPTTSVVLLCDFITNYAKQKNSLTHLILCTNLLTYVVPTLIIMTNHTQKVIITLNGAVYKHYLFPWRI